MKKLIFLLFIIIASSSFSAPSKTHRIRMVLNVVHGGERMINIQDATIDKKVFQMLVRGDENLIFLEDIGFRYIKSITIDINNDTKELDQMITIDTVGARVIVKKIPFFKNTYSHNVKYVMNPNLFKVQKYDNEFYYLASRSY